jgi:Spy/CpxP family protein refolding chaperone
MTPTRSLLLAALALWGAIAAPAHAQPRPPGRMGPPAFLRELFPPQLIMRHQSDIGLTDAQRQAITKEMAAAQADVLDVRWKLEEKTAALTKLLSAEKIDETAALTAADEVLKLEERLKRVRLGLMIRVKNQLTPAQQESLKKLMPTGMRERRGEGDRPGGPPEPPDMPEPPEGPEL